MLHSIPEPVDPVGNAPPPPSTQLLNPDVLMVEPAEDWYRCYEPNFCARRKSGASLSNER